MAEEIYSEGGGGETEEERRRRLEREAEEAAALNAVPDQGPALTSDSGEIAAPAPAPALPPAQTWTPVQPAAPPVDTSFFESPSGETSSWQPPAEPFYAAPPVSENAGPEADQSFYLDTQGPSEDFFTPEPPAPQLSWFGIDTAPPVDENVLTDQQAAAKPETSFEPIQFTNDISDSQREDDVLRARRLALDVLNGEFPIDSLTAMNARRLRTDMGAPDRFYPGAAREGTEPFGITGTDLLLPGQASVLDRWAQSPPYIPQQYVNNIASEEDQAAERAFLSTLTPEQAQLWNSRGRDQVTADAAARLWADYWQRQPLQGTGDTSMFLPGTAQLPPFETGNVPWTPDALAEYQARVATAGQPPAFTAPGPAPAPEEYGFVPRENYQPSLTIDRLAALPNLEDFMPAADSYLQYGPLQELARTLTGNREILGQAPTFDAYANAIRQANPDADPEALASFLAGPEAQTRFQAIQQAGRLTQTAIDEANSQLAQDEARLRLRDRLNALDTPSPALTVRDENGDDLGLPGRVVHGVYVPDEPTQLTPYEEQAVKDSLKRQGYEVQSIQQPGMMNPLQEAVKGLGLAIGAAGAGNEALRDIPAFGRAWGAVTSGGTTIVEQVLRPLQWEADRGAEALYQGLLRLPDQILPKEDQELKYALLGKSRAEQNALLPAFIGTLADPEGKAKLAEDIRNGAKTDTLNQEYSNIWKEIGYRFGADPLSLLVGAAAFVKGLAGLDTAGGLINLEGRIRNRALADAMRPVTDAEAVPPWEQMRRLGDVRALGTSAPADVLGTRGVSARASSARTMADEVTNLLEIRLHPNSGGTVDELEPIMRSLAGQGGEAAAQQFFNGVAPNRILQNGRFLAPDVVEALDTPKSALRLALDQPVYEGPGTWSQLPPVERAKSYANADEKLRTVLGTFQETATRAARARFGLDPEKDRLAEAAQQMYRGVLSNVYLINPRYYVRNAVGDAVTAWSLGASAWMPSAKLDAFERSVGRLQQAARGPAGEFSSVGEAARGNPLRRLRDWLGGTETARNRTIYATAYPSAWNGRRAASVEDGFDAIAGIPGAAKQREAVQNATSVEQLRALRATGKSVRGADLNARVVLGDLDEPGMMPALRDELDRLAARGRVTDADIDRILEKTAQGATQRGAHFGTEVTADDLRNLKGEMDGLIAKGTTPREAMTRVIADFAETHNANARIAGKWGEIEERLAQGPFSRELSQEQKALQAKHRDLRSGWANQRVKLRDTALSLEGPERGRAWDAYYDFTVNRRREIDRTVLRDLDGYLTKVRTAQEGAGVGGPKAVNGYKSVSAMQDGLTARLEELRGQLVNLPTGAPSAPAGAARFRPELSSLPDWIQDNVRIAVRQATNAGVLDDIERLSAEGLTAEPVAMRILPRLRGMTRQDATSMVRGVRLHLGIPSQEGAAEPGGFLEWQRAYRARAAAAPARGPIVAAPVGSRFAQAVGMTPEREAESIRGQMRDIEEALKNLNGNGAAEGLGDGMTATGATAAAAQSAKEALLVQAFADRLPGAVKDWNAAGPLTFSKVEDARAWNQYIDTQIKNLQQDRIAADAMANGVAKFALHNYAKTYDYDWWLRWIAPWELWTSRTMAKLPLRMADHPAYFSKVAELRESLDNANNDLPDFLRQKVKTPVPFLPDWMADHLYFDPVKIALPTDMLDQFQRQAEQDTTVGRARAVAAFMGVTPGPVADALLAMVPRKLGGGGLSWWDTQSSTSSPLTGIWSAVAAVANKAGIDMPYRPVVTESQQREARRQLGLMLYKGEISQDEWNAATEDLEKHLQIGPALRGAGLANKTAWTALQRAQASEGAKFGLSAGLVLLNPTFDREADNELYAQTKEWANIRDTKGKDAAQQYLDAHPALTAWWHLGDTPQARLSSLGTSAYFDMLDKTKQEYQAALDKLPLFGTDKDRTLLFDERERKRREEVARLQEQYPGWAPPPDSFNKTLPEYLADSLRNMPSVRDSNGVKDGAAFFDQRDKALKALVRPPVAVGPDMLDATTEPVSESALRAALAPKTVDGAAKAVIEDLIAQGWKDRASAGANATTREERTRAQQAFEKNWQMPDREQLADLVMKQYPGIGTREQILNALDTSVPQTLQQAGALSDAEKLTAFRAAIDPKTGVSTEPFYANKNAGVVIRTEGDLARYQKAQADDALYKDRRARNDPTYVKGDTEDRAWLFGGETGAALYRMEQSVLAQALGPLDADTGLRDGTKGKGWTSEFRFPDGTKMKAIDAYHLVNKMQTDQYAAQNPESAKLPSEKADEAKQQTASSNATSRASTSGAQRASSSGSRTTAARTSGTTARSGSRNVSTPRADAGPLAPDTKYISNAALSKSRLTATNTDGTLVNPVREEWRKGLGLTPEDFARLTSRYPDVEAGIARMETLQGSLHAEGADQNAITKAIQDEAIQTSAALEKARATENEHRAGRPTPSVDHIADAYLSARALRAGAVDFDRAFRTGTTGVSTPEQWAAFTQAHPEIPKAVSALSEAAKALKTDDPAPDDAEAMMGFDEQVRAVAALITAAKASDVEKATEEKQAKADERRKQLQAEADERTKRLRAESDARTAQLRQAADDRRQMLVAQRQTTSAPARAPVLSPNGDTEEPQYDERQLRSVQYKVWAAEAKQAGISPQSFTLPATSTGKGKRRPPRGKGKRGVQSTRAA